MKLISKKRGASPIICIIRNSDEHDGTILIRSMIKDKEGNIMSLPNDPFILLSVINTRLRDFYPSLEECCKAEGADPDEIIQKMASVQYVYDPAKNQFVRK